MPFIWIEEEADYKFRLICRLKRLRRSILDGDNSRNLVLHHVDLCCFDYPFTSVWLTTRCGHYMESLRFEHRFRERIPPLPIFVSRLCVESYHIPNQNRGHFYVPVDCPEWFGLVTDRALHVPTLPVFYYYSNWVFKVASAI